jgi:hypothetical protein
LGDSFGTFSFGQTQLGGLFLDFNFKKFMGATSKGLLLDFFWPIVVWAHLRDLFESFLGTLWNFGHNFFSLGTFERSIWSKAHFKGSLQRSLWSFFKTPLSQSAFERPLKP